MASTRVFNFCLVKFIFSPTVLFMAYAVGVAFFACTSALGYYLFRLVSRDLLGKYNWYKILMKRDNGLHLFELYILSIVNATVLTVYGFHKMLNDVDNTVGCKRVLASALGYFLHDFIAIRSTWRSDTSTVIHHLSGICLIAGRIYNFTSL